MKWIKFLKDYDGHKAGEVVSLPEQEAKVLVKMQAAEDAAEPKEVAEKTGEAAAEVMNFISTEITKGFDEIKKGLKAASKRPIIEHQRDLEDEDPQAGFKHVGEYLTAVRKYAVNKTPDERLDRINAKAPTTYAQEGVGADGGFLVAPDYNTSILRNVYGDESLLPRCRQMTTTSNTWTSVKDETTPWGTDGVQAYWTGEAQQLTESKPKLGEFNLTLNKLTVLVPVTNELLEDSVALGQYINQVAPDKIVDKVNGAIVNGTGAGMPLGFLKSGALITQAKETNQAANTLDVTNIANVMSLMPSNALSRATWLYHSSVFPQVITTTIGGQPAFFAPGNLSNAPYGTLFGRPIIPSEQMQPLGSAGDIVLADLSQYLVVTKSTGIRQEMSMHIYFDRDMTAFRFVFRIAGAPWLSKPIKDKNGNGSKSPFVTLAARA